MMFVIFCVLLVVPLLELSLLVEVAKGIGLLPTICLSLFTAAVGAHLAKREFRNVWQGWQKAVAKGSPPGRSLVEGVLIALGALLLFVPGVVTDALGFFCLIPQIRRIFLRPLDSVMTSRVRIMRETVSNTQTSFVSSGSISQGHKSVKVIDAEYESIDELPKS